MQHLVIYDPKIPKFQKILLIYQLKDTILIQNKKKYNND